MKKKDRQNNIVAVLVLVFFILLGYYLIRPSPSKHSEREIAAEYHPDSIAPKKLKIDWELDDKEKERKVNYYALYPALKQEIEKSSITLNEVSHAAANDSIKAAVIDSISRNQPLQDSSDSVSQDILSNSSDSLAGNSLMDTLSKDLIDSTENTESPEIQETIDVPICIIIVGAFKDSDNVEKMLKRLEEGGYSTTQSRKNNLTLVGVATSCIEEELRKDLAKLRTEFAEDAYVQ